MSTAEQLVRAITTTGRGYYALIDGESRHWLNGAGEQDIVNDLMRWGHPEQRAHELAQQIVAAKADPAFHIELEDAVRALDGAHITTRLKYMGPPEPILVNGVLEYVEPWVSDSCDDPSPEGGTHLRHKPMGRWQCESCGEVVAAERPDYCPACEKQRRFTPLYPVELEKPIWKPARWPLWELSPAELYALVERYVRTHIVLPQEDDYGVVALWCMATWLVDDWSSVPYLMFIAPFGSGKSRGLEICQELSYRGYMVSSPRSSPIFRSIELWHTTLLLDEAEKVAEAKDPDSVEIMSILNNGYRRGAHVLRSQRDAELDFIPRPFDVFGFKALAATKSFSEVLESRSIVFHMSRAKPRYADLEPAWTERLRSALLHMRYEWLGRTEPSSPESENARVEEIMTPLLTVARMVDRACEPDGYVAIWGNVCEGGVAEMVQRYTERLTRERKVEEAASFDADIVAAIAELREEKRSYVADEGTSIYLSEVAERLGISSQTVGYFLKRAGIERRRHKSSGMFIDLTNENTVAKLDELERRYLVS